ncbi:MAG: hypothetical protein IT436_13245 [Phycisphaerales bacterium]|nr:hypothetical protein [Phycisphaerales bacterium]
MDDLPPAAAPVRRLVGSGVLVDAQDHRRGEEADQSAYNLLRMTKLLLA